MNSIFLSERVGQIRGLGMDRTNLRHSIGPTNASYIEKYPELRTYIEQAVDGFLDEWTYSNIISLHTKLQSIEGIKIPDIAVRQQLYQLIISHLLLPVPKALHNGVIKKGEQYANEVRFLVNQAISRINTKLDEALDSPFTMFLGDETVVVRQLQNFEGLMLFQYNVGGQFGMNFLGSTIVNGTFQSAISVRLGTTNSKGVLVNEVRSQDIEDMLIKYFGSKKNKARDPKFSGFSINTKTIVDSKQEYGLDMKAQYFVLTLTHEDVSGAFTEFDDIDYVMGMIQKFLGVQNFLYRELGHIVGWDGKFKKAALFQQDELYYESLDAKHPHLSQAIKEKFSGLMAIPKDAVSLKDVGGQERAKKELQTIIYQIKHPDLAKQYGVSPPRGLILYGPPGTGKTLLARGFAKEVDGDVYILKITDIAQTAYINDGAKNMSDLFKYLQECRRNNPDRMMIVIMDELDALFKKRGTMGVSGEDTKIVNTFLTELGGFDDTKSNIIFVGITNSLDTIDEAVKRPGRLGKHIYVGLPDLIERESIFRIVLGKKKLHAGLKEGLFAKDLDISLLAKETEGFSGADIEEIISQTADDLFYTAMESENKNLIPISSEDIINKIRAYHESKNNSHSLIPEKNKDELRDLLQNPSNFLIREALTRALTQKLAQETYDHFGSDGLSLHTLLELLQEERGGRSIGFR